MSGDSVSRTVAQIAVTELLDVRSSDSVAIIADDSGLEENRSIIWELWNATREKGADVDLVVMEDTPSNTEEISQVAEAAMRNVTVVIGITKTTVASIVHHATPTGLLEEDAIRGLNMTKRSFEALTSPAVLDADFEAMLERGTNWRNIAHSGESVRVTSELGTDFTASLEGKWSWNDRFAHEAGRLTSINWGKVLQGPVVGTTTGTAVIDGAVLNHGWPSSPITIQMTDGKVTDISGDDPIVDDLSGVVSENENADNVAEISFGINDKANIRDANIWKKGLGRTQIAIGDGRAYGQPVESPVHIDMVMNTATVEIDGTTIIDSGDPVT